jgi:hypothetical protein
MTDGSGGALPNLVVIGAQKCGTSALHTYLALHPEVSMSQPKELDFFIVERNWARGIDWYRGHFDGGRPVRGESSPNYTAHPTWAGVPERMAELIPDARLIYIVRDPIDRIAAHWVHNWTLRRESDDPAAAFRRPSTYVNRSRYMYQLGRFLEHFPKERLLVLDQSDLRDRRIPTLERVFSFLGIDPAFRHRDFEKVVHVTNRRRRISSAGATIDGFLRRTPLGRWGRRGFVARLERLLLRGNAPRPDIRSALPPADLELIREDAAQLRAFTGLTLAHWSV